MYHIFDTPWGQGLFNNHVDKKRGEGVHQMSTIVHVREGGGQSNVHMDKILKKWRLGYSNEHRIKYEVSM